MLKDSDGELYGNGSEPLHSAVAPVVLVSSCRGPVGHLVT